MSRDRLDDRAFNKWVGDGKVTSDQTVEKGTNGRPEDEGLGKRGGEFEHGERMSWERGKEPTRKVERCWRASG